MITMENPKVTSMTTIRFNTDKLTKAEWKLLFGICAKRRCDVGDYFAQVMKNHLKEVQK